MPEERAQWITYAAEKSLTFLICEKCLLPLFELYTEGQRLEARKFHFTSIVAQVIWSLSQAQVSFVRVLEWPLRTPRLLFPTRYIRSPVSFINLTSFFPKPIKLTSFLNQHSLTSCASQLQLSWSPSASPVALPGLLQWVPSTDFKFTICSSTCINCRKLEFIAIKTGNVRLKLKFTATKIGSVRPKLESTATRTGSVGLKPRTDIFHVSFHIL